MARIRNNVVLKGASGSIGKSVVVKNGPTTQYLANTPARRRKSTPKQKHQMGRLAKATAFARRVINTDQGRAWYEARKGGTRYSAYLVAVSDFLHAPLIHTIDANDYAGRPGDIIRFRVTDNVKVQRVFVRLSREDGSVIEEGEATERGRRGLWRWECGARCEELTGVCIQVCAMDYAGNETKGQMVMQSAGGHYSIESGRYTECKR